MPDAIATAESGRPANQPIAGPGSRARKGFGTLPLRMRDLCFPIPVHRFSLIHSAVEWYATASREACSSPGSFACINGSSVLREFRGEHADGEGAVTRKSGADDIRGIEVNHLGADSLR